MSKINLNLTDEQITSIFEAVEVDMESVYAFPSLHEAYCDIQQYIWYGEALEKAIENGFEMPEPMTDDDFALYKASEEHKELTSTIEHAQQRQKQLVMEYPQLKG